jgi:CheY-like chemotaxis protein
MVYGFVRQSGGHMDIVSAPGRGTTVTLRFVATTLVAADGPPAQDRAAPAPPGRGERVLLVEDQARVRLLLRRQLVRLGYEVIDVPDARAALDRLAEAAAIDLILTDVVLPGDMNGVQLGEAALARVPRLALVFTTGYAADVLSDRPGPLAGATVLRKPVDPDMLARSLRAALDRRPGAHSPDGENM